MHKYFLTTYRWTKGQIHQKLCILQKRDLYLNQFSNKKGAIAKPESPKKHPIWVAHPRTHLFTKYPLGLGTQCFVCNPTCWHSSKSGKKNWHVAPKVSFSTILTCIFDNIHPSLMVFPITLGKIQIFKKSCDITLRISFWTVVSIHQAKSVTQISNINRLIINYCIYQLVYHVMTGINPRFIPL